jgi:ParB family chromosome partitioning protein
MRLVTSSSQLPGIVDDLNMSQIIPSGYPLRIPSTKEIKELCKSIQEKGLLNAIVVRMKNESTYEIVAGNRRYMACKALGCRKIPCQIVELDDRSAFELSLIENIQRKSLYPMEEAQAFKKYVSDFGWGGASELAEKIGKSVSYITKRIRLLKLPPDVIDFIISSAIDTSTAEELLSVKDSEKQSELAKIISTRDLNVRQTRKLLDKFYENRNDNNVDWMSSGSFSFKEDLARKSLKSYDRSISILRVAMSRIGDIINNLDDDDWITRETLMYHKNMLHDQIDKLIKEKRKKLDH